MGVTTDIVTILEFQSKNVLLNTTVDILFISCNCLRYYYGLMLMHKPTFYHPGGSSSSYSYSRFLLCKEFHTVDHTDMCDISV